MAAASRGAAAALVKLGQGCSQHPVAALPQINVTSCKLCWQPLPLTHKLVDLFPFSLSQPGDNDPEHRTVQVVAVLHLPASAKLLQPIKCCLYFLIPKTNHVRRICYSALHLLAPCSPLVSWEPWVYVERNCH